MHICYVIPSGGGPETYVLNISNWLISKGHRVSVIATDGVMPLDPRVFQVAIKLPLNLHYFAGKILGSFQGAALVLRAREKEGQVFKLLKKIEASNPVDIVEVIEGIPVTRLKKFWKTVVRIHGSDWTFRHYCKDSAINDAQLINLEKKQLFDASGVVAFSRHSAEHVSVMCSFPYKNIRIIPGSMDVVQEMPQRAKYQNSILFVGRLEPRKGADVLCSAMEKIWARYPETELYFLGREAGLTKYELLNLIPEKFRDRLRFMGFVSRKLLAEYYAKAALYVAPTQHETFGYTILEAMSFGVPIVSTEAGSVPELIEDGMNGSLVPVGDTSALSDAILDLLQNPEKRERFRKNGLLKAAEFKIEKIGPRMLEFYESLKGKA